MHVVTMLVANESASPGLFEALGIDWKLLIEQGIAFLILVAILAKFVYPVLIKAIDGRRSAIEAGLAEAKESQQAAERAQDEVAELLVKARKEADDILARSHQEASAMVATAEEKAKVRAEGIVADAREQLQTDIAQARRALKAETIKLVASATEQVIGERLDDKKDGELIGRALENTNNTDGTLKGQA